jgi:hypothetical protein
MGMTNVEIMGWLHSMGIYDYDICDGIVHVVGDVDISDGGLTSIPVQFGYVSDYFICRDNNLESLKGCPSEVGGSFYCNNNNLVSLEGCPSEVGGSFYCNNNNLVSLEGCPSEVGGTFYCSGNKLNSLEGGPKIVGGTFDCSGNKFKAEPYHSDIKTSGGFRWKWPNI